MAQVTCNLIYNNKGTLTQVPEIILVGRILNSSISDQVQVDTL